MSNLRKEISELRDLKKEISLELINYQRKFGKRGKVLLLGEEEWNMLHDKEDPPLSSFDDDGYADKCWSLTVYRTYDKSLIRVGGKE